MLLQTPIQQKLQREYDSLGWDDTKSSTSLAGSFPPPFTIKNMDTSTSFLTKREQACITLLVPESGDPELDDIIIKARIHNAAMIALQNDPKMLNESNYKYWAEQFGKLVVNKLDEKS